MKAQVLWVAILLLVSSGAKQLTTDDIKAVNSGEQLRANFDTVKTIDTLYDMNKLDGSKGDMTFETLHKQWDGVWAYHIWDSEGNHEFFSEDKEGYARDLDGHLIVEYFIDDGYFEEKIYSHTQVELFVNIRGVDIISVEEKKGAIRVVGEISVQEANKVLDQQYWRDYGLTDGRIRIEYEADKRTGLIDHAHETHIAPDQTERALMDRVIEYDMHVDEPLPEFVQTCREKLANGQEADVVYDVGMPNEKTYTYRTAKDITMIIFAKDIYGYYAEADFSEVAWPYYDGNDPAYTTLYAREE